MAQAQFPNTISTIQQIIADKVAKIETDVQQAGETIRSQAQADIAVWQKELDDLLAIPEPTAPVAEQPAAEETASQA